LSLERFAHAGGNGAIRFGLIGCGGRSTGAAVNAMNAGNDIQLVALADVFRDRLDACRRRLKAGKRDQVAGTDDRCFVGFDAYKHLIESGVDVVLIAAASHFHPVMLKACVDADKHIFCEKPHALDVPGLKIAMAACEQARKKGLSIVSGLCWRYDPGVRETMRRVLDVLLAKEPVAEVEVQAIQVGPAVFLAHPAEMFCQFGLDMKSKSPFPFTFPVSFANGCVGYISTEEAFGEHGGGYETRLTSYSNLEVSAGRQMVQAALALAREMTPSEVPTPPPAPPFRGPWSYGNVPPELE